MPTDNLNPNRGNSLRRTAAFSVGAAVFLVLLKLIAGLAAGSVGLVASAADSAVDVAAALLTLLAVRVAIRPPDREHNYGHGKAEHLAALGESSILALVSLALGYESLRRLLLDTPPEVVTAWWTFVVLAIVIGVDLSRAVISSRAARAWDSAAMASNALHFASDLAGSMAVVVGLVLVAAGEPRGDAGAALFVAVLVMFAAVRLAVRASSVLMDKAPAEAREAVSTALDGIDIDVRRVRVRQAADRYFVDLLVASRADAGLAEAHAEGNELEKAIHRVLPGADVIIHAEPDLASADIRERATAAALGVPGIREVHNVRVLRVHGTHELSLHVKLPRELPLTDAHDEVEHLEQAIMAAVPKISAVHTHIEPLAEPTTAVQPHHSEVTDATKTIGTVAAEVTGYRPSRIEFRDSPRGRVAFVEALMEPWLSLQLAHRQAGRIEARVRQLRPELAEVIVHSEPLEPDS